LVRYTYATLGAVSGNVVVASIYVRLVDREERDLSAVEFEQVIRKEFAGLAGVTASVFDIQFSCGYKQMQIQLRGDNTEALAQAGEMIMAELLKVPGAVDVGLSTKGLKPELDVQLNRGLAGSLGISVGQVAQALRPAFAGIDVGDWLDPQGETRDVTVRLAPEARARALDLETLPLRVVGPEGGSATIPLGQVARVEESMGPAQIDRLDRERVINVEANTQGRPLTEVIGDIE